MNEVDIYALRRRAAFWDRWRLFFHEDIEKFSAESAAKHLEPDEGEIQAVVELLKNVELITMKKFYNILGYQINAAISEQERGDVS